MFAKSFSFDIRKLHKQRTRMFGVNQNKTSVDSFSVVSKKKQADDAMSVISFNSVRKPFKETSLKSHIDIRSESGKKARVPAAFQM